MRQEIKFKQGGERTDKLPKGDLNIKQKMILKLD